jgi:hypothetical protein
MLGCRSTNERKNLFLPITEYSLFHNVTKLLCDTYPVIKLSRL